LATSHLWLLDAEERSVVGVHIRELTGNTFTSVLTATHQHLPALFDGAVRTYLETILSRRFTDLAVKSVTEQDVKSIAAEAAWDGREIQSPGVMMKSEIKQMQIYRQHIQEYRIVEYAYYQLRHGPVETPPTPPLCLMYDGGLDCGPCLLPTIHTLRHIHRLCCYCVLICV